MDLQPNSWQIPSLPAAQTRRAPDGLQLHASKDNDRARPFLASPVAQGGPSTALFHFANALGRPNIVPGDGDWRQLGHGFRWLLTVAQERDKYVDGATALPARLLFNGSGQVAALYLRERLRKRVKADERNLANEVPALKSHQRAQRHIVIGADNHVRGRLHPRQCR